MVRLILGSIFDSKCDLIIIPCNEYGGLSWSVIHEMKLNNLSISKRQMSAGEVYFEENNNNFNNASVIGYAASVSVTERLSKIDYLQNIAKSIEQYCINNSLHIVNIPLLGTGAGHMQPQESFEIMKTHFENSNSIYLNVFAYSAEIYSKINYQSTSETNIIKNPRVFISYTGYDPDNRAWVKSLANKLRQNGVDARLDMFHLKVGQELPQWMTNELMMADKVLLICDKYYAEKADTKKGGVGWETMIIQGDMLLHSDTCKYICIVRDQEVNKGLPIYVRSRYSLHWPKPDVSEEDFHTLLFNIFDCDIAEPVKPIPTFIIEKLVGSKA